MTRIEYAARATRDLKQLLHHINAQDPGTADAVSSALRAAIARLAIDPRRAVPTGKKNIGRYPLRKHRVAIFVQSQPRKKVLRVLRILRAARVKSLASLPR